jgi:hypothetical protein
MAENTQPPEIFDPWVWTKLLGLLGLVLAGLFGLLVAMQGQTAGEVFGMLLFATVGIGWFPLAVCLGIGWLIDKARATSYAYRVQARQYIVHHE